MNRDNVIFILVDSVTASCIGTKQTQTTVTPFIDSIAKEGLLADNIYSFAPYTDAATIGLYCGIPTLEKLGYFYGINAADENHFRLFKENGYETFGFFYPYYLVSNKTKQYIDHTVYTAGFEYGSVWGGKLNYYAEQKKKRELTETEYTMIIKCMDMVFSCWFTFYKEIEAGGEAAALVKSLRVEERHAGGHSALTSQYNEYTVDKKAYIDRLLDLGMEHPITHINEYCCGKEEYRTFCAEVFERNRKFFRRVNAENQRKNLRNNRLRFKKAVGSALGLAGIGDRSRARYIENYGMLLFGNSMMEKRAKNNEHWQEVASFNRQTELLFDALQRRDKNKPFYASLHVEEAHHNVAYFSYDSLDHELVEQELRYLAPLVENCGRKFSGNLLYLLSIRYVDLCVKRLFSRLEAEGLLENTTVVLVSDHGSSYFFDPIRTHMVNTFHKENYHVPCLMWKKNMKEEAKKTVSAMFTSEDVLPTLCGIADISVPPTLNGKNMYMDEKGREYIITEYMGPGVPDMLSREVWMSIRNARYVIAYKNKISEPLDIRKPYAVYDILNDPKEEHNLWQSFENGFEGELAELAARLNERYQAIQRNTQQIMDRLSELNVE